MRQRLVGAGLGLAAAGSLYLFAAFMGGWVVAAALFLAAGWFLGGQFEALRQAADHDELTGTNNRAAFERMLQAEWERAVSTEQPLSLLLIDVNDFGLINKVHGHLFGDEVLRTVGGSLQQGLRPNDFLARWGGEEFAILLPHTYLSTAVEIAEQLRMAVKETLVSTDEASIWVNVTVGVASYPEVARTPEELLRRAIVGQLAAKVQKNAVEVVS